MSYFDVLVPTCEEDIDCDEGDVCNVEDGVCELEQSDEQDVCEHDEDCDEGLICNDELGVCENEENEEIQSNYSLRITLSLFK